MADTAPVAAAVTEPVVNPDAPVTGAAADPVKPAIQTDIDPKQLQTFAKLSRSERELRAKVKELTEQLEKSKPDSETAGKWKAIEEARKAGKRIEALRLIGMDTTEELDALLAEAMASDGGTAPDGKALDELKARLDGIEKARSEDAKAKAEQDEKAKAEAAKQEQEKNRTAAVTAVSEALKAGADKWPLCSAESEDTVNRVLEATVLAINKARATKGKDWVPSDQETEQMLNRGFDALEKDMQARARAWAAKLQPSARPVDERRKAVPVTRDTGASRSPEPTIGSNRGSFTKFDQPTSAMSWRQAKQEAINSVRK